MNVKQSRRFYYRTKGGLRYRPYNVKTVWKCPTHQEGLLPTEEWPVLLSIGSSSRKVHFDLHQHSHATMQFGIYSPKCTLCCGRWNKLGSSLKLPKSVSRPPNACNSRAKSVLTVNAERLHGSANSCEGCTVSYSLRSPWLNESKLKGNVGNPKVQKLPDHPVNQDRSERTAHVVVGNPRWVLLVTR